MKANSRRARELCRVTHHLNVRCLDSGTASAACFGGRHYPAENAIRPFVVGRKGWLFSDTQAGARASALIYSLVETAKANGLEPYLWLRNVLQALPTATTVEDFEALLPWNQRPEDLLVA